MCVCACGWSCAWAHIVYIIKSGNKFAREKGNERERARMRHGESKKGSQAASQPASHPDKHIDSHTTNLEAPICFPHMQQFNKCKRFKFQNRGFQEIICFATRGERFQWNAPRLPLRHDAHLCILNAQETPNSTHSRA